MGAVTSEFSVGLAHKFCTAFTRVGGTPAEMNAIAESGDDLLRDLLARHRGLTETVPASVSTPKVFQTWRALTFVVYHTVNDLAQAVEATGSKFSSYTRGVMAKIPLAKEPIEIELVLASARDLGITWFVERTTIFAKASEHGLDPCPPEAGPQLCRQYQDQPKGELLVAMELITDAGGGLDVFFVLRAGTHRFLDTRDGGPDHLWPPDSVWVFARRKPQV